MRLKIHSDQKYLATDISPAPMLYPFWGLPNDATQDYYEHYMKQGPLLFEMVSLKECDFAVLPASWEDVSGNPEARELALQFAHQAQTHGKRVIVFFLSDSTESVPLENVIVFRTSLFKSSREANEFAMPAWCDDFASKYFQGQLPLREKQMKPVIGFCGTTGYYRISPSTRLRVTLGQWRRGNFKPTDIPLSPTRSQTLQQSPYSARARALKLLRKSGVVKTNFSLKRGFFGGARRPDGSMDEVVIQKARADFVKNMADSDYIVCARGEGNFSFRLYETLSSGRIPVFINTDCVLPYDLSLNWKEYCVWIEEGDLPQIAQRIATFHQKLSSEEFVAQQKRCRTLWKEKLSPEGFFTHFHEFLQWAIR